MNVGAVVLAAEKSARKGQNKQFLKLNGMTIIENILDEWYRQEWRRVNEKSIY